jgi:hypothetical protein
VGGRVVEDVLGVSDVVWAGWFVKGDCEGQCSEGEGFCQVLHVGLCYCSAVLSWRDGLSAGVAVEVVMVV